MNQNKEVIKQFLQYVIVGGIATIVEWVVFYLLNTTCSINYMLATALAFLVSTFANWLAGRLIMFKKQEGVLKELGKIYLTSIAGLLFNLIIMWLLVEKLCILEMLSKIIATGIVFFWNFLVRKYLIYKI